MVRRLSGGSIDAMWQHQKSFSKKRTRTALWSANSGGFQESDLAANYTTEYQQALALGA